MQKGISARRRRFVLIVAASCSRWRVVGGALAVTVSVAAGLRAWAARPGGR